MMIQYFGVTLCMNKISEPKKGQPVIELISEIMHLFKPLGIQLVGTEHSPWKRVC